MTLILTGQYFQYKVDFISPGGGTSGYVENVSVEYNLLNSAPEVSIIFPVNEAFLNYDEGVDVNFTVEDSNLEGCWYSIDGGVNVSLPGCSNFSLDVSQGSHEVLVFANDSFGEIGWDSVEFEVDLTSPFIEYCISSKR
jgi:hypothetical protein